MIDLRDYQTSTTTPVINKRFVVTYNLGGSSVILTASGTVQETLDAFPYGGLLFDNKVAPYFGEKNKYAQTVRRDRELNYAQARYQDPTRGQFLSEDPIFLNDPKQQNLTDPQSLNSYSYANDNPIGKSDPNGKFAAAAAAVPP